MGESVEEVFGLIAGLDLESVTERAHVVPDQEMGDGHSAILKLPMAPFCVYDATPEMLETFSEFTEQNLPTTNGGNMPVVIACKNGEPEYVALERKGKIFLRPVMKWERQVRKVAPKLYERLLTQQIQLVLSSANTGEGGDN